MAFENTFKGIDESAYDEGKPVTTSLTHRMKANGRELTKGLRVQSARRGPLPSLDPADPQNLGNRPVTGNALADLVPVRFSTNLAGFEVSLFTSSRRYNSAGNVGRINFVLFLELYDDELRLVATQRYEIQTDANINKHETVQVLFRQPYTGPQIYGALAYRLVPFDGGNEITQTDLDLVQKETALHWVDVDRFPPSFEAVGPTNLSADISHIYANQAANEIWGFAGEIELLGWRSNQEKLMLSRPVRQDNNNDSWTVQQFKFLQVGGLSIRPVYQPLGNELVEVQNDNELRSPPHIATPYADALSALDSNLIAFGPTGQPPREQGGVTNPWWPTDYYVRWPYVRGGEGTINDFVRLIDVGVHMDTPSGTVEVLTYLIGTIHSLRTFAVEELEGYEGVVSFDVTLKQLPAGGANDWDTATVLGSNSYASERLTFFQTMSEGDYNYLRTQAVLEGALEGPAGAGQSALFTDPEFYAHREGVLYPNDLDLVSAKLLTVDYTGNDPTLPVRLEVGARILSIPDYPDHDLENPRKLTCVGWSAWDIINGSTNVETFSG